MANTNIDIINDALTHLAVDPITSLDDQNQQARVMSSIYYDSLDDYLEGHDWNFAMVRTTLSGSEETPNHTYDYAFTLPSGCLRVVSDQYGYDYKVEDNLLLTNESSINIKYISSVTDVSKYSYSFIIAFGLKLAIEACYSLTGNSALQDRLEKRFKKDDYKARVWDAREGSAKIQGRGGWRSTRGGGSGRDSWSSWTGGK